MCGIAPHPLKENAPANKVALIATLTGSYSSGSRSCSLRFCGSPVIASVSASRCCDSTASPASRYVHGTAMQKVLEYEQYAAECLRMAGETKDPLYKEDLEKIAGVWERLAREWRQGIIENEPSR